MMAAAASRTEMPTTTTTTTTTTTVAAPTAPHGVKRPASDALETEQRLAKRFDLLNLENLGKLYIPVASNGQHGRPIPSPASPTRRTAHRPEPAQNGSDDYMQLEDTKDKVYIYDLDNELSDVESDSETPIFLSDIEKHLSKVPKHILRSPDPKPNENNQLVLYSVPASLTVPEERDSVRKAIVEARERMRERQALGAAQPAVNVTPAQSTQVTNGVLPEQTMMDVDDPDAMEVEEEL